MKKIFFSLSLVLILFFCFGGLKEASAFSHKTGDIFVTKSTSAYGLTGHSGIVIGNGSHVIHHERPNTKPTKISISDWHAKYKATKVVRHSNATTSKNAGDWAIRYYVDGHSKDFKYDLTKTPTDRTSTYCSKLV